MNLLIAFAPFIAFAVIDRLIGSVEGLIAGAIASIIIVGRDVSLGRKPKILEIGSVLLFGGLALYAVLTQAAWTILGVRLRVDLGLMVIVLVSIAIRQPFTLQYAREEVPQELWSSPAFLRTNDIISGVWALAFAVLVIADMIMLFVPDLHRFGIFLTIAALAGAFKFTKWYPQRVKAA